MKTLRPMSPHLSIYKPQKGSILSIWHRLSGVIVAFFLLLLFFWIRLLTFFGCWNSIVSFLKLFLLNSIPYWFVLCLIYFVLFLVCYHILNGCRHILSDL
uniref:succinate:cytochrome c oxidoreductase subunit 3 n=1 Tax=Glaucosphaera vacuolata TaxID=38265 RepID=UPI001FCCC360|nr:succinate:cytochrome c oxidoreductase subunit 3 [Glaucosphaera vacuolata]UNJ18774.1 succinate:cytochrome c oxidoreductase subunit 3 [Glaucosphaera vacuolata]